MNAFGASDDAHHILADAVRASAEHLSSARAAASLVPAVGHLQPENENAAALDVEVQEILASLPRLTMEVRAFAVLTAAVGASYRSAEDFIQDQFVSLIEQASYLLGLVTRPLLLQLLGAGVVGGTVLTLFDQLTQNPAVRLALEIMLAPVREELETLLTTLLTVYGSYLDRLLLDPQVLTLLGYGTHGLDDFLAGILGIVPLDAVDDRDAVTLLTMLILPLLANGHKVGSRLLTPRESTDEEKYGGLPETAVSSYSDGFQQIVTQNSDIVIHTYQLPDGTLHYQVFVQGTQDWSFIDSESGFDAISNLENAASHHNLYGTAHGLELALLDAGIPPGASLDLFGYSQGGAAAALVAGNGTFDVQSLTTYGAPSGFIDVPEDLDWVQLQNDQDLIAKTAGMSQHDSNAMVIEMSPDLDPQTIFEAHQAQAYALALAELEASGDTVALDQMRRRQQRLEGAEAIDQTAYELDP